MSKIYKDIDVKGVVFAEQFTLNGEYTLPTIDGTAGQIMITDGSGNITFVDSNLTIDTSTIDLFDDVDLFPTSPAVAIEIGAVLTWDGTKFIPADLSSIKRSWSWTAGRNANLTNSYLRRVNGVPTQVTPYVVPFDCKLRTISCSTQGAESWTAEIRVDSGSGFAAVASLTVVTADQAYSDTYDVLLSAGDEVAFYCNGTNIVRPAIDIWLIEK